MTMMFARRLRRHRDTHAVRLRDERGSILVISAVLIPVFLLMCALVVDGGNWFTHKRQLQTRADAGALAAGVEYLSQLRNCVASPTTTGAAIAEVAKQYAGDPTAAGAKYNEQIAKQSNLTVTINGSDGKNPCEKHALDSISAADSYWTNVKVRETNLGTLFGAVGLDLPAVAAQARVEVKQLIGVERNGLPFVNETGDQVDCAWAQFVDVDTGDPDDVTLVGGTPNPVPLTRDPSVPGRWTASVGGIDFTSKDDIAVRYWLGTKKAGSCSYDPTGSNELTAVTPSLPNDSPAYADYINVFNNDSPKNNEAPLIHIFDLRAGSCGGPGYIYSVSIDPNTTCTLNFRVQVDSGGNPSPSKVTVSSSTTPSIKADATGPGGTGVQDFYGTLTFKPNAVKAGSSYVQDYTQVGLHRLSVSWTQTSGKVGGKTCSSGSPCTGTFESGATGCKKGCDETLLHATYVADPLHSAPIESAELTNGAGTPIQNSYPADGPNLGAFTVVLNTYGIDQQRTFILRDSVQNTGNRSHAVDCGQGNGESGLGDAIENGCPDRVGVNTRNDVCTPQPAPAGYRDCVSTVPGNKTAVNKSYDGRFDCTPNNWVDGSSPGNLNEADPRFAYIFLTSWGRIVNAKSNGTDLPIRAFLRVYVTGWDSKSGACAAENDPAPANYDGKGSVIWGHFVDVITLDDSVIVGDEKCDLTKDVITCKPQLVR
jgi:Flp pilus assembly protein TadG